MFTNNKVIKPVLVTGHESEKQECEASQEIWFSPSKRKTISTRSIELRRGRGRREDTPTLSPNVAASQPQHLETPNSPPVKGRGLGRRRAAKMEHREFLEYHKDVIDDMPFFRTGRERFQYYSRIKERDALSDKARNALRRERAERRLDCGAPTNKWGFVPRSTRRIQARGYKQLDSYLFIKPPTVYRVPDNTPVILSRSEVIVGEDYYKNYKPITTFEQAPPLGVLIPGLPKTVFACLEKDKQKHEYFDMLGKQVPGCLTHRFKTAITFWNPENKTQRVMGNAAARLLMSKELNFSKKVRDRLVSLAEVFVAHVEYEAPKGEIVKVYDYVIKELLQPIVCSAGAFSSFASALVQANKLEKAPFYRQKLCTILSKGMIPGNEKLALSELNDYLKHRKPTYKFTFSENPELVIPKLRERIVFREDVPKPDSYVLERQGLRDEENEVVERQGWNIPEFLPEDKEMFFDMASLVSFFTILKEVRSAQAIVATCFQFLRNMRNLTGIAMSFFEQVVETYSDVLFYARSRVIIEDETLERQGVSDFVGQLFEVPYHALTHTEFGTAVMAIISSFSIMGVLSTYSLLGDASSWKLRVETLQRILASEKSSTVDTFITRIISFVSNSITRVLTAIAKKDLAFLFGATLPSREWLHWTEHLINSEEILDDPARPEHKKTFEQKMKKSCYGPQITGQLAHADFLQHLRRANEMSGAILAAYAGDAGVLLKIRTRVKELDDKRRLIESFLLNGAARIQPYGIFIAGPPGIGKGQITGIIHQCLAQQLNRDPSPATVHTVEPGANFPVFNPIQWFAVADDIDINPSLPSPGSGLNHAEVVMKYINTKPMNMEAADIPNKGKNWANFLAMVYCTNNEDGRLKFALTCPLAFWRRFKIKVTLEIKDEFSNNGVLDPSKIKPGYQDVWKRIVVSRFNAGIYKDELGTPPFDTPIFFYSLTSFLIWLGKDVDSYIFRATETVNFRGEKCPVCSLNLISHPNNRMCDLDEARELEILARQSLRVVDAVGSIAWVVAVWVGLTIFSHISLFFHRIARSPYYFLYMREYAVDYFIQSKMMAMWRKWEKQIKKAAFVLLGVTGVKVAFMAIRKAFGPSVERQSTLDQVVPVPNLQKSNSSWTRVPIDYARPYLGLAPKTFTLKELCGFIRASQINFKYNGCTVKAHHIGKNVFMTVFHVLGASTNGDLSTPFFGNMAEVSYKNMKKSVLIEACMTYQVPGKDLALFYLPEMAGVPELEKRIPPTCLAVARLQADAAILVLPGSDTDLASLETTNTLGSKTKNHLMWAYPPVTSDGDCGSLCIGVFGNNFSIVGMHFGRVTQNGKPILSYGEDINMADLSVGIMNFSKLFPVSRIVFECEGLTEHPFEFQPLPAKSNLGVNQSGDSPMPVLILGSIPGYRTNTFKSKVVPMPERETWSDLEERFCGRKDYFEAPNGKGEMIDDKWVSPFTTNMDAACDIGGSWDKWKAAADDYLDGAELLTGRDRARPLTEYEAIMGVPGTDIGGIDLNTSVGPPYNCPKKRFVTIDHESKTCSYSEEVSRTFRLLDKHILAGEAVAQVCNYVLKDEAISFAKNSAHRVRVFNVMSFAINIRLKQYLGPLLIWMRTHPFFFETAIGMNVTSYQWSKLREWLGVYPNWMAADNGWFDVKEGTREGLTTADVFRRMGELCGYSEEEILIMKNLILSCMFTMRNCNSDVFIASFMMCSGFWATIIFNTVRNCLQRRYVFNDLKPYKFPFKFRDGIRQITLGDDNGATTCWKWYNQRNIQLAAREFGAVITDSNKNPIVPEFDTQETFTFLKRKFVLLEDVWVAPIELKTLVKMVTVRVKGTLSDIDHVCQLYSNVLAEAWMHGREIFELFSLRISAIVEARKWVSTYYRHFTYDVYLRMYREGVLSIWDPLLNLPAT